MMKNLLSKQAALKAGKWATLAFAGYVGGLYLAQRHLVFRPTRKPVKAPPDLPTHHVEPILLGTEDGHVLEGWMLWPRQGAAPYSAILYFGGRRENVAWMRRSAPAFAGRVLALFNYRGYGRSSGRPSERRILRDALLQYDLVVADKRLDKHRIAVAGRSLGTAVAAYVAAERAPAAAVLLSPYDSMLRLAKRHVRLAPVSLLLRHRFEVTRSARWATCPCLVLKAERDQVIPHEFSDRLIKAWAGPVESLTIPRTNHLSLPLSKKTLAAIAEFLERRLI